LVICKTQEARGKKQDSERNGKSDVGRRIREEDRRERREAEQRGKKITLKGFNYE
jgi:hypothetical protein